MVQKIVTKAKRRDRQYLTYGKGEGEGENSRIQEEGDGELPSDDEERDKESEVFTQETQDHKIGMSHTKSSKRNKQSFSSTEKKDSEMFLVEYALEEDSDLNYQDELPNLPELEKTKTAIVEIIEKEHEVDQLFNEAEAKWKKKKEEDQNKEENKGFKWRRKINEISNVFSQQSTLQKSTITEEQSSTIKKIDPVEKEIIFKPAHEQQIYQKQEQQSFNEQEEEQFEFKFQQFKTPSQHSEDSQKSEKQNNQTNLVDQWLNMQQKSVQSQDKQTKYQDLQQNKKFVDSDEEYTPPSQRSQISKNSEKQEKQEISYVSNKNKAKSPNVSSDKLFLDSEENQFSSQRSQKSKNFQNSQISEYSQDLDNFSKIEDSEESQYQQSQSSSKPVEANKVNIVDSWLSGQLSQAQFGSQQSSAISKNSFTKYQQ